MYRSALMLAVCGGLAGLLLAFAGAGAMVARAASPPLQATFVPTPPGVSSPAPIFIPATATAATAPRPSATPFRRRYTGVPPGPAPTVVYTAPAMSDLSGLWIGEMKQAGNIRIGPGLTYAVDRTWQRGRRVLVYSTATAANGETWYQVGHYPDPVLYVHASLVNYVAGLTTPRISPYGQVLPVNPTVVVTPPATATPATPGARTGRATATPTATPTFTPTATPTFTPTATPTATPTRPSTTPARPTATPRPAPDYRWIDVNLTQQTLIAYEGNVPVMVAQVSTGKRGHETTVGTWAIYWRLPLQDMDGGGTGPRDPYYNLKDVPWIQYFHTSGEGLHGTYWHDNFGTPMSHGCVNLSDRNAYWLYQWAHRGTPVVVHY